MARTNQKSIKTFKSGKSKQQTAELKFLQAVQDWYADKSVRRRKVCYEEWRLSSRVRYSKECPEFEKLLFWYTYGFNRGVVTITFEWFKDFAKGAGVEGRFQKESSYPNRVWPYKKEWTRSHRYSGQRHEKKSVEWHEAQASKREWREKKKKHRGFSEGPRSEDKKRRARRHRGFCKQVIHHGNWDLFHQTSTSDWEYSFYIDPLHTWA